MILNIYFFQFFFFGYINVFIIIIIVNTQNCCINKDEYSTTITISPCSFILFNIQSKYISLDSD